MRLLFIISVLGAMLVGCASVDPRHTAAYMKSVPFQHAPLCLAAIDEAEKFDANPAQRIGLGLVISSILGPAALPINAVRADAHAKDKAQLVTKLERECNPYSVGP